VAFLGTNGWYTTPTGNTTCVLIDSAESYVICDAGNGLQNIDQYIKDVKKPIYLFMSHFHIDHITGMHILNKFKFPQGMTICCYEDGREILEKFVCQPFTVPFKDLKMKVDFKLVSTGEQNSFPFGLIADDLIHSSRCFGYRFTFGGKIIVFCTDTGYCPAALKLAQGADLLLTECAYLSGQNVASWPHLNPEEAAKLAKESSAKRLGLIHFDAENYKTIKDRDIAEKSAQQVFPNTFAAQDGMVVEI
jgi:ribonuclease BN (tRNA processing enzyme)